MSTPGEPAALPVFVLGNFVQACCWRVAHLPAEGETVAATGLHVEPGGKGLNVAVGLSRLGCHVATLIGCGQDAAADALWELLAREKIATTHVHRLASPSGMGAGLIAPDGRNLIAVYPGANALLTAQHAYAAAADIGRALLVYGHFETAMPAVEAAFAIARKHGVATVLNPSPWSEPCDALRTTTTLLLVNETEAAALLGLQQALSPGTAATQVRAAARRIWAEWPACQTLVVTLGAHGALALERQRPGEVLQTPAVPVQAVDTVGAGDAFASGLCWALARGLPLHEALASANACGALVASAQGVLGALPTQRALQTFSRSR